MTTLNCHIYIRVSTKRQKNEGYSLDYQEQECRKFIENKKFNLLNIYKDSESGGNSKRPGYLRMKDSIRKGEGLVIYSISRLSRDRLDSAEFISFLQKNDIKLYCVKEGDMIDINTSAGRFILNIMTNYAAFEKDEIVSRSKVIIADNISKGQLVGTLAYGMGKHKFYKRTFIYPIWFEQSIINFIIEKRLQSEPYSWSKICRELNEKKVPPKRNNMGNWSVPSVKKIFDKAVKDRKGRKSIYYEENEIIPYEKYRAPLYLPLDIVINNVDEETGYLDYDKVIGVDYDKLYPVMFTENQFKNDVESGKIILDKETKTEYDNAIYEDNEEFIKNNMEQFKLFMSEKNKK